VIRYVLAVVLTVALVGIGWAGLEHAAVVRSEQQVESQIAAIDEAAVSLAETDDLPATGQDGPRRVLELIFPHDGLTSEPVDTLRITPGVAGVSVVEFTFDGRAVRTATIDAPIRDATPTPDPTVDLSGETGTVTIVLTLTEEAGTEYVELRTVPAG